MIVMMKGGGDTIEIILKQVVVGDGRENSKLITRIDNTGNYFVEGTY